MPRDLWLKYSVVILALSTVGVLSLLAVGHRDAQRVVLQTFAEQQREQAEQAAKQIQDTEASIQEGLLSLLGDADIDWTRPEIADLPISQHWRDTLGVRASIQVVPGGSALRVDAPAPHPHPLPASPEPAALLCPVCLQARQALPVVVSLPRGGSRELALTLDIPLARLGERLGTTRQGSSVWWAARESGVLLATADVQWIGADLRASAGECGEGFLAVLQARPPASAIAEYCWPNGDGSVHERIAGYQALSFLGLDTIVGVSADGRAALAPMDRSQRATFVAAIFLCGSAMALLGLGMVEFRARTRQERGGALSTIAALGSALEARDPYTRFHSENVSIYAWELAGRLGMREEEQEEIRVAGLMHDIGKIGICDGILNKPGHLTPEERVQIERHAALGEQILSHLSWARELAFVVGCHHEKMDGTGYPRGLCGEAIPRHARIIAVADVFDALLTDRPYRAGLPLPKVLAIIEKMCGSHLDPEVVEALRRDPEGLMRLGKGVRMDSAAPAAPPSRLSA